MARAEEEEDEEDDWFSVSLLLPEVDILTAMRPLLDSVKECEG